MVISSNGISTPYIVPSGTAANQYVYVVKCLGKKLVPYIKTLPENTKYIFWPDLASAHYSKKDTNFLLDKNIKFVSQPENLPNVPECRGI